ncbi:hypothetical protein BC830DRAFT_161803 [Chytriomyces sp. MP71]|nr:hypothetical protein BC830DRAFT_161803 [Chytriomyces sp. MP71]
MGPWDTLIIVHNFLPVAMAVYACIGLVFLLGFIVFVDLKGSAMASTLQALSRPTNAFIIAMWASFPIYGIAESCFDYSDQTDKASLILAIVALGIMELSFICFSWFRAKEIFRAQLSAFWLKGLTFLVQMSPLYCFMTVIPLALQRPFKSFVFLIFVFLPATATILIDLFCVASFAKHTICADGNEKTMQASTIHKLRIVAVYGLMASLCALIALALFFLSSICVLVAPSLQPNSQVAYVYYLAWIGKDFALFGVGHSVLFMKLHLVWERQRLEKLKPAMDPTIHHFPHPVNSTASA